MSLPSLRAWEATTIAACGSSHRGGWGTVCLCRFSCSSPHMESLLGIYFHSTPISPATPFRVCCLLGCGLMGFPGFLTPPSPISSVSLVPKVLCPLPTVTYFGSIIQLQEIPCLQSLGLPSLTPHSSVCLPPHPMDNTTMCSGGQAKTQGVILHTTFSFAKFNAFTSSVILTFRMFLDSNQSGLTSSLRMRDLSYHPWFLDLL